MFGGLGTLLFAGGGGVSEERLELISSLGKPVMSSEVIVEVVVSVGDTLAKSSVATL
jgi:hypothetical protein